jgi:hypothetical protein
LKSQKLLSQPLNGALSLFDIADTGPIASEAARNTVAGNPELALSWQLLPLITRKLSRLPVAAVTQMATR